MARPGGGSFGLQDGPDYLGAASVFDRVPAGPGTQGLDQQQSSAVRVICAGAPYLRIAGVIVADQDSQLAPVEGEDERTTGWSRPCEALTALVIADDEFGGLGQAG